MIPAMLRRGSAVLCLCCCAVSAGVRAAEAEWINDLPAHTALTPLENGFKVSIVSRARQDGLVRRVVDNPPPQGKLFFSARVRAEHGQLAYLQIKLLRKGKETARFTSPGNPPGEGVIAVGAEVGQADTAQLLCRTWAQDSGHVGAEIRFTDLRYGTEPPAPDKRPRFNVVPGYEVCGIYVNGCVARTPEDFSNEVLFREEAASEWRPALPLVYAPGDGSARGSLLRLREDTAYRVRVVVDDSGKKETLELPFRTLPLAVPVGREIVLSQSDAARPLVIRESGRPGAYLRYTARPGVTLDAGNASDHAVYVDGAAYVVLDGLAIRGGGRNGIYLNHASHVQVVNCDIAGFGRAGRQNTDREGKYYEGGRAINNDAGIRILGGNDLRIERNYIHDPRGTANSWFHSHPAGPNALFLGNAARVAIRYNDFIGSDAKRWNDAVESANNGEEFGGPCRDAEISGNFFAFGNDDGMELDGGQVNCRFFRNRVEGMLCGVSTAPCLSGPSYLYENLFAQPGDEYGGTNTAIKNGFRAAGPGRIHFFNNTAVGDWAGMNPYSSNPNDASAAPDVLKGVARNNLFSVSGIPLYRGLYRFRNDFDYDLLFSPHSPFPPTAIRDEFGQERHAVWESPRFRDSARGDFRLAPDSPGVAAGTAIPGFMPMERPSMGAFQADGPSALPYRPVPFHLDAATLFFDLSVSPSPPPDTVGMIVDEPGKRVAFKVLRNEASPFIEVAPDSGVAEYGKPLRLTVAVDPRHVVRARKYSGAFLVRTPDGFSRVVTVYADATGNRRLLDQDRAEAIYGQVVAGGDREAAATLVFDIPEDGRYYLFTYWPESPPRVPITIRHGENDPFEARLHRNANFANPVAQWAHIATRMTTKGGNRPLSLPAGRQTLALIPGQPLKTLPVAAALARNPETFMLSPYQR